MNKICNRNRVQVEEIDFKFTNWGTIYCLYVDASSNYYVDADDNTDNVNLLSVDEGQEPAEAFSEHMASLESEVEND